MTFLTFLIKDLLSRKIRLALTLAGVSVGIAACVMMLGLSEGIRGSFRNAYGDRRVDIVVYERDEFNLLSSRVPSSLTAALREMPQVKDALGVLMDVQRYQRSFTLVFGWPENSPHFENIKVVEGRRPDSGRREVIIGTVLARTAPLSLQQGIRMGGADFTVVGVYESNSPFERSAVIMPLEVFQAIDRNKQGIVTSIDVMLKEEYRREDRIREVAQAIEASHPEVSAQNADVFIREKTKQMVMGEKISLLIAAITIVAVVLGLANTMITSIFEKRKLMGILIALGWQRRRVIQLVFWETLLITVMGGFLGTIAGCYSMDYLFDRMDLVFLVPAWDYGFLFKIVGLILLVGVVAALIPSWITVRLDPIEVIRGE